MKMMETGIQTLKTTRFLCPECGTTSRLPEGIPTGSVFRLTCYQCGHKVLVRADIPKIPAPVQPSDKILRHPELPKNVGTPKLQSAPQFQPEPTIPQISGPGIFEKLSEIQNRLRQKLWELTQKFREIKKNRVESDTVLPSSHSLLRKEKITFEKKPFLTVRREIGANGQHTVKTLAERLREQIGNRNIRLPNVILLSLGAVISLLLLGMILFWVGVITRESELKEMISLFYNHQPSVIYDRDGKKVSEIFAKKTSNLEWDAYPENLKKIVLLVEDRKFFPTAESIICPYSVRFL